MPAWYVAATQARSIAIIGASSNPAKNHYQEQLTIYGFKGAIFPINPKETTIGGLKVYANILDVPEPVDVALIAVPAQAAAQAVRECVQAGVPLVYVFALGFSEIGEEGRQREVGIREALASAQGRTRMLGPNGTGILSVRAQMVATPLAARTARLGELRDNGVAMVSQSGLVSSASFITSQQGFPAIGTSFAIGNELDLGVADVIDALVQDDACTLILCYVEGLRQPERFIAAARRAGEAGKPIVLLKGGTTSAGAEAAATHTASLSGADHVFSGVLAQVGVRRADSVAHLLDVTKVLAVYPRFAGRRFSLLTGSGGLGIMGVDSFVNHGFTLAGWAPALAQRLRKALPTFLTVGNPLDGAGDFAWGRPSLRESILCADQNPDTDFIVLAFGGMLDAEASVAEEVRSISQTISKPLFVVWVGGLGTAIAALDRAGIPAFGDLRCLGDALAASVAPRALSQAAPTTQDNAAADLNIAVPKLLESALASKSTNLDEVASKTLLKLAGIAVIEEAVAADAQEAALEARKIGYPVVMKLRAPGLMHKSELNAVSLNIKGDDQAREQAERLLAIARGQSIAGADVVIQRQVPPGLELLIGMHTDLVFGRVITFGMGGVLTEALADVQCFRPDVSFAEFGRALASLHHQKLLAGYRNLPAASVEVLWPVVQRFAALVRSLPAAVREVDVNPLIVEPGGRSVVAVDALVVLDHSSLHTPE